MNRHSLCAALASWLMIMGATAAAAKAPAKKGWAGALPEAVAFCEKASSRADVKSFPVPIGGGIRVHPGDPTAMGVPDLVKRFAATQPLGRLASPAFYIHFPSSDGQIWAVVYDGLPACDLMLTGAGGDMPAAASGLAKSLEAKGWRIVGSTAALGSALFAQHDLRERPISESGCACVQ
jgi:hypothetical protein